MTLEAKLRIIQKKLEDNRNFPNESSISQGIVLPILQELNWDIFDTMVVRPEYLVSGRVKQLSSSRKNWADFALCNKSGNPKVFIEVKNLDAPADDGVDQVIGYAQKPGAPDVDIAVWTDGRNWSLYLPFVEGRNEEKWVFKRNLSDLDSLQESSEVLQRCLEKNRVSSGEALKTARVIFFLKKLRNDNPALWKESFDSAIDEYEHALDLLTRRLSKDIKSAQAAAIKPDIVDYFHSLLREKISPSSSGAIGWLAQSESEGRVPARLSSGASEQKQSAVHRRARQVSAPVSAKGRRVKVVIEGKPSSWQDQSDAMATVFKKLQKRDQNFCQKFYKHSRNQRKKGGGKYLARNLVELFGDPLSSRPRREISDVWVISTNYGWEVPRSKSSKKEIIRLAAEVAGLKFKEDISEKGIIVNLDP